MKYERATPTAVERIITPPRRKRARVKNEFLPDKPPEEELDVGSLAFDEILDGKALKSKHVVINRAPVMTAWAAVVAERLNFKREEALSIASVYTEMNAISRGVAIGKYDKSRDRHMNLSKDGPQPYVDLMGRRIPLYQTQEETWQALSNNTPVPPTTAFGYISRSFRQTTPAVIGALRLLANSYSPEDLNKQGYALYCEFRPQSEQWGKRSEMSCAKILSLRKPLEEQQTLSSEVNVVVNAQAASNVSHDETTAKGLSLEEFEAALDDDHTFDEVSLDFSQGPSQERDLIH